MPQPFHRHLLTLTAGITLLTTLIGVLAPISATAQTDDQQATDEASSDDGPSDKDMKAARQEFIEGRKDYKSSDFSNAADHFLTAYELSNRTELLYNIGKAYRKAGRLVDAEHYFRKYLRRMPEAQNADEVGTQLVEINRALAKQMASLQINSNEPGRLVYIDDDDSPRCLTPCDLTLESGDYTVRLDADGFQSASKNVSLSKGGTARISLALDTQPATGELAISTGVSGGMLTVDGNNEYGLPLDTPITLSSGSHQLNIKGPDGGDWSQNVDITSGERATLFIPASALQPANNSGGGSSAKRLAGVGLLGASAALIAGGLILGSQAQQTHDALSSQQQTRGIVDSDLVTRGRAQMSAANILLGAGAGAFLGGSGLITWDLVGSN
jgi:hypothetical protein